MKTRRQWLASTGTGVAALTAEATAAGQGSSGGVQVVVDPQPLFPLSPLLYMQFMEPLGVTDSSVEAAWDYTKDEWRPDFVEAVKDLAPGAMRFGGNFSRYYKWREGVGDVGKRPMMRNYDWGGKETNRVGTHEFVQFSRAVGAEPFYCVNFLGEGISALRNTPEGDRTGTAQEAAEWVSYANDPSHKERTANGSRDPYNLKLWQIGNETSYVKEAFPKDEAIQHTIAFARAMRERDPSIQLIGWGDKGRGSSELWAKDMLQRAGRHLDYVAIHMMGQSPKRKDTVLDGNTYQRDPEQAWAELLELSNNVEARISELEAVIAREKPEAGIAVTEGHLSLRPHNVNPVLTEWISAVYHARSMNIYERHGKHVKIATAADFNGTRWTVMAVHTPVPRGKTFLLPVGSVARLFGRHRGDHGIAVQTLSKSLDIAGSRSGEKLFLHVANVDPKNAVTALIQVQGRNVSGGRVFEIAPSELRTAVNQDRPDAFVPKEKNVPAGPIITWQFPAASVSAVEVDLASEAAE